MSANNLFFSRDTKLYIELIDSAGVAQTDGSVWEIPILDGYSFSQSTNTSEITLSEAASSTGASRRGRKVFTDNFAPAEFSFSTYVRPVVNLTANNGRPGDWEAADVAANVNHAVEEVLWALFTGDSTFTKSSGNTAASWSDSITQGATNMVVDFSASNKSQLGRANLYFVMGGDQSIVSTTNSSQSNAAQKIVVVTETAGIKKGDYMRFVGDDVSTNSGDNVVFEVDTVSTASGAGNVTLKSNIPNAIPSGTTLSFSSAQVYKLPGSVLNEVSVDFDLEGIATLNWSGMADIIEESFSAPAATIYEGITSTSNFIRNKISTLALTSSASAVPASHTYDITLTGGNITMTNNITFLTPEEIGTVNKPIGHVTGTRSITGSFTCYLNTAASGSADLFQDIMSATTVVTHDYSATLNMGGTTGPCVAFTMPQAHVSLPAINIEDVVSVEVTFDALPSSIPNTDEITITYKGA